MLPGSAVRRQAEVGERFRSGFVGDADLQHLARLFGCGDRAAQLFCHTHMPLDHLNRRHTLALCGVPEVVFDTGAGVLPQGDANRGKRVGQTERRLVGEERAMRRTADQLHQVKRICAAGATGTDAEEPVHRPHVVTLADEPLDEFETVDVAEREVWLDPVLDHPLDVLQIEIRRGVGHHVGHGVEHRRIFKAGSLKGIIHRMECRQVIEGGAT